MKIHPRYQITAAFKNELESAALELSQKHKVTSIEAVRSMILIAADWSKYPLREERHPNNPEKKADEA